MNLCESCKANDCSSRKSGRVFRICYLHEPIDINDLNHLRSELDAKCAELARVR